MSSIAPPQTRKHEDTKDAQRIVGEGFIPSRDHRLIIDRVVSKQYYKTVPKKIRELMRMLKKAGFVDRGGKGSHRNYSHPRGTKLTLSGNPSDDAKRYQKKAVERALRETAE